MPYRPPNRDDFNHAVWLRRTIRFNNQFDTFIEGVQERAGRARRPDAVRNLGNALNIIIANLYRNHIRDENKFVIIDRSNDGYRAGPYNPLRLNSRCVRAALNYLLGQEPSYLEERGGNYDPVARVGYASRFRATERLVNEVEEIIYQQDKYRAEDARRIIRNTLSDNPQSLIVESFFRDEPLPLIRLRGVKPQRGGPAPLMNFNPTDDTLRMEDNLQSFNRFLSGDHWIDLLIPDSEFKALSRADGDDDGEPDAFGDDEDNRWEFDILARTQLYRVFNNGRFTDGGRFYGGWWQGVPARQRKYLTINWFPTAELDYSNMQIAMLYADEGLELEGDAYAIEDIPQTHRKLVKRTVFKIINADGQIRAPLRAALPQGWEWNAILEAVREKHRPIARYFGTGEGVRLQKRDADIAEEVMLTMKAEGTLVLPIHDSFVVEEGRQGRLREVMVEAYERHLRHRILVDDDETLFSTILPADADELVALGVRDYEEWIDQIEEQPGYANYRQRRSDFITLRGEAWGQNHRWHR